MKFLSAVIALLLMSALATSAAPDSLCVPAHTAYIVPDPNGARVAERSGVTRWSDPAQSVNWYGELKQTGTVTAKVLLRLPDKAVSKLQLSVAGQSREMEATGRGLDTPLTLDFGRFEIGSPGYQRFCLASRNEPAQPCGDIDALELAGPAVAGAHFNLEERRNAASVHLGYPVAKDLKVAWFYCEVTAVEDPVYTFYMACGFHRGYFGMQVNSATERRIIFSVWDSGGEPVSRDKVSAPDRVQLIAKGEGVYTGDFGNEGTGGHSHLKYLWKTGEKQRFLLGAKPVDETHTIYAGYYWHPDRKDWMLISCMKAPKDGSWLRGLHGFSENFGGSNGNLRRKALYGNQWIVTDTGEWKELTTARFTHDPTGRTNRLDRFMGVEDGQFFLSHGGFVNGFTPYGEQFTRPPSGGQLPLKLPALPLP